MIDQEFLDKIADKIGGDERSTAYLTRMFCDLSHGVPDRLLPAAVSKYCELIGENDGGSVVHAANTWLREFSSTDFPHGYHSLADDPQAIADAAQTYSKLASRIVKTKGITQEQAIRRGESYALQKGVACNWSSTDTDKGKLARLSCARWWRRQLRKLHWQIAEETERNLGAVSATAGKYASAAATNRRKRQLADNLDKMMSTNIVAPDGTPTPMAIVQQHNVTSKTIRRYEVIARIKGIDEYERAKGNVPEFWTITAPSRFHATHYDGRPNKKYDGSNPRDCNTHLLEVWADVRIRLHQQKIKIAGLRVTEPHHDGTPHHHYIVYVPEHLKDHVWSMMKDFATRTDAHELETPQHVEARCKRVPIDERGVVSYVIKYVAKNLDGSTVDDKCGKLSGAEAAARVDAWASHWCIRQFAFFGQGAPIELWRQLRRMESLPDETPDQIKAMHEHARAGHYGEYIAIAAEQYSYTQYIVDESTGEVLKQNIRQKRRYAVTHAFTGQDSQYDGAAITKPDSVIDRLTGHKLKLPETEWTVQVNDALRTVLVKSVDHFRQYVSRWEHPDDILLPF